MSRPYHVRLILVCLAETAAMAVLVSAIATLVFVAVGMVGGPEETQVTMEAGR